MSIGNTKDQGNKGNNFPYQLRNLQLLGAIQECCSSTGLSLAEIIALLTSIDADTSNLDVALSTRNAEATQLLIKALLTTIDADTSNLDVALSSRLADATFTSRINTLGQKTSAQSTPVVLPSDQIINVNTVNSSSNAMSTDAFGRMRVSNPLTLFDSSHRYRDNGLWNTLGTIGGTAVFSPNEGLVNLNVTGAAGSQVIRETAKVFSYQPGKSLLVFNTFVMAPAQPQLRQRVGYFGTDNGIYIQLRDDILSFVERSSVTGGITESIVPQAVWNVDTLDGNGPSGVTLDITKAQILFMDIEWLGEGTVRLGFVIDGVFILCHRFNHANLITSTYITTASLPLRYEITNEGTATAATLKQVCSTVISEGGYELRGAQQAIGTPILTPRTFPVAGTFYPIVGIRLVPTKLDAIVILTAVSLLGLGNGKNYAWRVVQTATITGGLWTPVGVDSAVAYNLTGTSATGGRVLAQGYVNSSNQGSPSINILKAALFSTQLERNTFTGTPYELVIEMAIDATGGTLGVYASLDWEEISR
jgi:DNA-binding transcriptional MerR regulator